MLQKSTVVIAIQKSNIKLPAYPFPLNLNLEIVTPSEQAPLTLSCISRYTVFWYLLEVQVLVLQPVKVMMVFLPFLFRHDEEDLSGNEVRQNMQFFVWL